MFNKKKTLLLAIANELPNVEKAARTIAESNRELTKAIEAASNAEIKARDRVDISLEEYERLKEREKQLSSVKEYYEKLLSKLGVPIKALRNVDIGSIVGEKSPDPIRRGVRYRISFFVNDVKHDIAYEY